MATASSTVREAPGRSRGRRARPGVLAHRVVVYVLLIVLGVLFALPFLWMVSTALKPSNEVFTYPPQFIPTAFLWQNFVQGWTILPFTTFLINSMIVTCLAVLGNLVSCTLAAYGFARLRGRGRRWLFIIMIGTIAIPQEVTIVPTFILFSKLHLVDTLVPLFLPAWFGYPFFIFLLRQFFSTIPRELDDAARIDGASTGRIFTQIILPLAKPALAAVAVFAFVGNWNNLIGPLIYLRSTSKYTMALGLDLFLGQNIALFNDLMAVSVIAVMPIVVVFFVAQRFFIQGISLTGLSGR